MKSPFQRVVDDLTLGCGCACHVGVGYNTSCEHCRSADSPRCFLCHREDEILAGTYTRVNFGGDIGIVLVCDSCSEKADIPPREWVMDMGAYALVIDEGE